MTTDTEPILLTDVRVFDGAADRGGRLAVLLRGGIIEAVAPAADVSAPGVRRIDLDGAFVLPGLTDSHMHVELLGQGMLDVDLFDCGTPGQCADRVAARAADTPAGEWVVARGWRKSIWPTDDFPTAAILDEKVAGRPVYCKSFDGHCAWVNSAAMARAGVTADTPDPDGGEIARDEAGRPTGVFKENAIGLIRPLIPQPTEPQQREAILRAQRHLNELGIAGVHSMADLAVHQRAAALAREGELTLRFSACCRPGEEADAVRARAAASGGDLARLVGVKMFLDGTVNTQSAAMFEPFTGGDSVGILTQAPEAIREKVAAATARGLPSFIHAIGDRAVSTALDAIESAGGTGLHHRIEHAQVVRVEDVRRMARLGVAASVQPCHILTDIAVSEKYLGPRAGRSFVLREMLDAGVMLAFGSDAPVVPADARHSLYAAVARRNLAGSPPAGWHAEQRVTIAEALRAFTLGAAESIGAAGALGRVAPGHAADLTVFAEDPLAAAPSELLTLTVRMTLVAGRIVHDA